MTKNKLRDFALANFRMDLDQFGKYEKDYKFERSIIIQYGRIHLEMTYTKIGSLLNISRQQVYRIFAETHRELLLNTYYSNLYDSLILRHNAHK